MNPRLTAIAAILFLAAAAVQAAEPRTEHTFSLADGETRPAATLEDAAMLVGSWGGEAFGSRFEETWNPPSAGSMVGLFKLYSDDGVAFYEIMLITVEDGTLSFYRRGPDTMDAWIVMRNADGIREEKLVFRRRVR